MIYIPASISAICSFLYYLPWIIDPREALGIYLVAFFWFLGAWIIMFSHLVFGIKNKIQDKGTFTPKEHFISASIIFCSYLAVFIGAANGFMVTV
ncbi:MAG: hypothetical protein AAF546_13915 [Verrucomicrobiota bacterium]